MTARSEREPRRGTGFPVAGLAAVLLFVVVDRGLLDRPDLLQAAGEQLERSQHLERGLVSDRAALTRAAQPSERPRVFVLGTSRARAAFRPDLVERFGDQPLPEADFYTLAHAQLMPLETAALAEEIATLQPAVVVWILSEFETHQPLRLVDRAAPDGLAALGHLAAETDLRFALAQRTPLLRLAVGGLARSYAYRDVLGRAWLDGLRRFGGDDRLSPAQRTAPPTGYGAGRRLELPPDRRSALLAELDALHPDVPEALRGELEQIRAVTRGRHAQVHLALVERTLSLLAAAGARLVLVELDIHPLARDVYDRSTREEFAAAAERWTDTYGVVWITREELGDLTAADFRDLTHLGKLGGLRITVQLLDTLVPLLPTAGD